MRSFSSGVSPREAFFALLLGAVNAASYPPLGYWPCALLSIALFLLLLRNQPWKSACCLGALYGLVFAVGTMYWFTRLFGSLALGLFVLGAVYYGLLAAMISLTRGHSPFVRALLVALFTVGVDWLRGSAWYLCFPWYTAPHALAAAPAWIAPVRWVGIYGLIYAIWLIAGLGAFARPRYWAAFLLLPACSLLLPPVEPPDHRALLLQAEETDHVESQIAQVPPGQVDLAVLPEYAYFCSPETALAASQGPALLARKLCAPVVFGAVEGRYLDPDFQNVAAVIDPQGNLLGTFPKQCPVPLCQDGLPGDRLPVFPIDQGILGVAICYDFDTPDVAASLTRQGATIFVGPTYDDTDWGWTQHLHHELQLRIRAVENDRWILRATTSGRSEAIDPNGNPSKEGVEMGTDGYVVVGYSHRHGLALGGQAFILGPVAAGGTVLFLLLFGLGKWRRRRDTPIEERARYLDRPNLAKAA